MNEINVYINWEHFLGIIAAIIGVGWYFSIRFSRMENSLESIKESIREIQKELKETLKKF